MRNHSIDESYEKFFYEIEQSNVITRNASQLLLFHVEDVLGMAQLKSGKFRKNESRFNVRRAIEDIVDIQ